MSVPTAEEILNKHLVPANAMIEFAKLHVKEALKEASENGEIVDISPYKDGGDLSYFGVDEQSILNSYPLENIK
jgi:hypothetical protein